MKPSQKSAPALQAPHNSGERVQNGDTALAGADTPSSVSTPAQGATALADEIARWLHDETSHPESYPNHTWPETERDDGQREGGFVKIVPLHGQEYFRDIARRLIARFAALRATSQTPDAVREKVAAARSRIGAMKIAPCSGIASSRQAAKEFEEALDALSTPSASAGPQEGGKDE